MKISVRIAFVALIAALAVAWLQLRARASALERTAQVSR